jgi:hypothetical protein
MSALVEQFRSGGVARDLRLMAAQGLLPLKPEDMVELWTDLVSDADEVVRAEASKSLKAFPATDLLPILKSRETRAAVLSWAASCRAEAELREAALQNSSLPDETVERLAPTLPERLAELVVINQVRLLRRASLLGAVEANPGLNNDQKRRLRELRETFRVGEVIAPEPEPERVSEPEPAPLPEPEPEPEFESAPLSDIGAAIAHYLSDEEREQREKVSAVQKVYRLNPAEKLITALKGSREERSILVRDPNRLVWSAVLSSQRTTDAEIESFSAMKNVSDQVLRAIGNNREWTKRYAVVVNLVKNPRTPLVTSLGFVPRLTPQDLRSVAVDRNVPEAVRKAAQRFVKRTKP